MIWLCCSIRKESINSKKINEVITFFKNAFIEKGYDVMIVVINDTVDQSDLQSIVYDVIVDNDIANKQISFSYKEYSTYFYCNRLGGTNWDPSRGRNWGLLFINSFAMFGDCIFFIDNDIDTINFYPDFFKDFKKDSFQYLYNFYPKGDGDYSYFERCESALKSALVRENIKIYPECIIFPKVAVGSTMELSSSKCSGGAFGITYSEYIRNLLFPPCYNEDWIFCDHLYRNCNYTTIASGWFSHKVEKQIKFTSDRFVCEIIGEEIYSIFISEKINRFALYLKIYCDDFISSVGKILDQKLGLIESYLSPREIEEFSFFKDSAYDIFGTFDIAYLVKIISAYSFKEEESIR